MSLIVIIVLTSTLNAYLGFIFGSFVKSNHKIVVASLYELASRYDVSE